MSDFEKGQIHALRHIAMFKIQEIADALDKSVNSIKKFLGRTSVDGSGDGASNARSNIGRRKCTTDDDDARLVATTEANPFASRKELVAACGLKCSEKKQ